MLSDLSANPMEVTLAGMHGKVHEGLMAAATYIHCNTGAALHKAATDFPGWPLLVTGHSMGGESTLHLKTLPSAKLFDFVQQQQPATL